MRLIVEALKPETRRGSVYGASMALSGIAMFVRSTMQSCVTNDRTQKERTPSWPADQRTDKIPEAARCDLDSRLNEALELTFPCSDPIAVYVERTPEPDEDPEADPESRGEQK